MKQVLSPVISTGQGLAEGMPLLLTFGGFSEEAFYLVGVSRSSWGSYFLFRGFPALPVIAETTCLFSQMKPSSVGSWGVNGCHVSVHTSLYSKATLTLLGLVSTHVPSLPASCAISATTFICPHCSLVPTHKCSPTLRPVYLTFATAIPWFALLFHLGWAWPIFCHSLLCLGLLLLACLTLPFCKWCWKDFNCWTYFIMLTVLCAELGQEKTMDTMEHRQQIPYNHFMVPLRN